MSGFRRPIQMYRKQETAHSSPKPEQPTHTATMQTQSSSSQETCQPNTATPDGEDQTHADKSHHQESMNQTMEINTQSENSFHPEHGTVPSNATKPDTAETEKN